MKLQKNIPFLLVLLTSIGLMNNDLIGHGGGGHGGGGHGGGGHGVD